MTSPRYINTLPKYNIVRELPLAKNNYCEYYEIEEKYDFHGGTPTRLVGLPRYNVQDKPQSTRREGGVLPVLPDLLS